MAEPNAQPELIREFAPSQAALNAGRLIIREDNYSSRLGKFDRMFAAMAADALNFVPPIELSRDDVEVVHYAGDRYKHTFGLEFPVPTGVEVSDAYRRITQLEKTL